MRPCGFVENSTDEGKYNNIKLGTISADNISYHLNRKILNHETEHIT